jgi:hypothetical protein
VRAFVVFSYFLFRFNIQVLWPISSVVELCNITLPDFQYLFLINYHVPLRVFEAKIKNGIKTRGSGKN